MPESKSLVATNQLTVLPRLAAELGANVLGQHEVLEPLAEAVCRREYGVIPQRGCRGAFMLAGPTGVGKTESARTLAQLLFGEQRFVRFDCSEFKTIESVMALLGDRQRDRGRFGQAYQRAPNSLWLFDEIEKAHPEFVQLFLQMTEPGRLTLANGETLDLSGIYLLVTSNLGSAPILGREFLPFVTLEKHVVRSVRRHFSPELLGRFGDPFVFRPLSRATQTQVAELHLGRLLAFQVTEGRQVTSDAGVLDLILQRGFSRDYGARPLLRALDKLVGNAIMHDLQQGGSGSGRLIVNGNHLQLVP